MGLQPFFPQFFNVAQLIIIGKQISQIWVHTIYERKKKKKIQFFFYIFYY